MLYNIFDLDWEIAKQMIYFKIIWQNLKKLEIVYDQNQIKLFNELTKYIPDLELYKLVINKDKLRIDQLNSVKSK